VSRPKARLQPVKVSKLTVPADRVAALAADERYAYCMLGHMFNELMCLQKLLMFAIPKHGDRRPIRSQPEMGQALFFFRVAAGKLWEAKLALATKAFSTALNRSFLPLVPAADVRLKTLRRRLDKSDWLRHLRDRHSFHYPTFEQWQALLSPKDLTVDDDVYGSTQSGNVYYAGSDNVAQHWMFGQMNSDDPRGAVDPMIDELIES
jgi:hypothetical protein